MKKSRNRRHNSRPLTRRDCAYLPRPCPVTECPKNMGYKSQSDWTFNPERHTVPRATGCLYDILDIEPYPHTLEEIGYMLGLTRERVRQIEKAVLERLQATCSPDIIDIIHELERETHGKQDYLD